jgi:membrane protein DedA with SNARE-associated domain
VGLNNGEASIFRSKNACSFLSLGVCSLILYEYFPVHSIKVCNNGGIVMNPFDVFLIQYGLAAIFLLLFVKSIGVPIPIPADLLILTAAASAAAGKFGLWQAVVAVLLALVLGGLIQFVLARGPGRGLLYRFGRYLGLTPARLDAASARVKKGGVVGISTAILVPGIRGVAIPACGLAGISIGTFLPGLIVGSGLFLALHFFLGYFGGAFFVVTGRVLSGNFTVIVALLLILIAFVLWGVAFRRQRAARNDLEAEGAPVTLLHEGICPACLALYMANQLRPLSLDK